MPHGTLDHDVWRLFIAGGVGSSGAACFSNPCDVAKTRTQLQGELNLGRKPYPRGLVRTLLLLHKKEGARALQKGLLPAVAYNFSLNSLRFGLFAALQNVLPINIICAATAGAAAAAIASPFAMVRVRLQSSSADPHLAVGHQHRSSGLLNGLKDLSGGERLPTMERIRRLYAGAPPQALRLATATTAQFTTYDAVKSRLEGASFLPAFLVHGPSLHALCGALANTAAAVAFTPVDCACTRMYNQPAGASLYSGVVDCMAKTFQAEGVGGLYKGFRVNLTRQVVHGIPQFVFLEEILRILARVYPP